VTLFPGSQAGLLSPDNVGVIASGPGEEVGPALGVAVGAGVGMRVVLTPVGPHADKLSASSRAAKLRSPYTMRPHFSPAQATVYPTSVETHHNFEPA
jgi:hypothetical protein